MFLVKAIIFGITCLLLSFLFQYYKKNLKKIMVYFFNKFKFKIQQFYRLINIKKRSEFVWKDLVKYYKESSLNFGQFEVDKRIEIYFEIRDSFVKFNYTVTDDELTFSAVVLNNFDEERTNDIMVLASHFNGLLKFGVVKVSLKYNYVEFLYARDLITYMLYSGEIHSNRSTHFDLTKDCFLTFKTLIETNEDPVFIFSELLRSKEEEENKRKLN
jgi:hypothetical protein